MVGFWLNLRITEDLDQPKQLRLELNFPESLPEEKRDLVGEIWGEHTIRPIRPKPLNGGNKVSHCRFSLCWMIESLLDSDFNHFD